MPLFCQYASSNDDGSAGAAVSADGDLTASTPAFTASGRNFNDETNDPMTAGNAIREVRRPNSPRSVAAMLRNGIVMEQIIPLWRSQEHSNRHRRN